MNKKIKLFLLVSGFILCAAILFFGLKFIIDRPVKKQLPSAPDAASLSGPLLEQISDATRNAYYFTTAGTIGTLGMIYHSCGDDENASRCYQLAIQENNGSWQWNYYLGYLNMEQGQSYAAIKNFNQVIKKDPGNGYALYYAGEAYQKIGSSDTAKQLFKQILTTTSNNTAKSPIEQQAAFPLKTYAAFQLARLYMSSSQNDSAETILQSITEDQPAFGPAFRSLSAVYRAKNNSVFADKYSVRANDLSDYVPPADPLMDKIALLSRSDQYLLKQMEDAERSGNYRWALTLCDQGLQYFPENKTLISTAVFENLRQGFDSKALSYLDKHFEYFNNDAKELMDATDLLYNTRHLPEAIRYFEQVRKLLPKNSSLALWLYDRGKKDEAIAVMNEIIKQNPGDENIIADNIRLLINMGDDEMANKYFGLLRQRAPSAPMTFQLAGLMAEKNAAEDSAALAYEKAYKLDQKDLIFTRSLIDFYIRQKNWAGAIGHFRSALEIYPNESFLLEGLGRLLIACPDPALKNLPEGIEYSQRAFFHCKSTYETKLSAGKTLATAYLSLGDKKNCTKYINKTVSIAEEINQSKEYIAYFRALISKRSS